VSQLTVYLPDILLASNQAKASAALVVDQTGAVVETVPAASLPRGGKVVRLPGKALLPGLANAHSHTFQRLFRGRAEGRVSGGDTFWTWREQMYRAAAFCSPEDLYDVARVTFLEMLQAGITVVGEFHYLHRDPDGNPYSDPNLLAHQVIAAAQSVGIRICLLRTAYIRAGFNLQPHPGQRRFYETPEEYLLNLQALASSASESTVSVGAAPHSIRAVPLDDIQSIAAEARRLSLPIHLHISEQPAENVACQAEYASTPVTLLDAHGLLTPSTTLVHAIHLSDFEFTRVAASGTTICSCPTTERNLGDGIFPADTAFRLGIPVAFGTDSQAQIDLLEDARQLEYHLRLRNMERGILDASARDSWANRTPIGSALFQAASTSGYRALGLSGGSLAPGQPADFFTIDLRDPSILGMQPEEITAQSVFALNRSAVRDVAVAGRLVLQDRCHPHEESIRERYLALQQRYRTN
jgi:formimidoylglutamate deiminase